MNSDGILIVISGPSGSGKGSVVRKLREIDTDIGFSVSATTRTAREGEIHGKSYYFITRQEFEKMIATGEVLEYNEYCGNYYGTPRSEVERVTGEGRDLILEIDVHGAAQIKEKFPSAVTVMLIPPTLDELEARLRGRGTETDEVIAQRLREAAHELELACDYDYVVVNRDIDDCALLIHSILKAEHHKYARMTDDINKFLS